MSTRELAHGIASLGRRGDSVLVHMQPEEVSGLQALARANGTSLTINPYTGMPEAFNLKRALGSVAKVALPIAAGFALGPGGFGLFSSSLGAGLAVGAGAYALTGDPMYALSAGLGGAGGFGLGSNLSAYGSEISKIPTVGAGKTLSAANATDIFKTPGLDDVLGAADDVAAASTTGIKSIGPGIDYSKLGEQTMRLPSNEIANLGSSAPSAVGRFDNSLAGIKGIFGSRPAGTMDYADFLEKGYINEAGKFVQPSLWQDVATVGMPVLSAMQKGPAKPPAQEEFNYEGPYAPSPRDVRMPTAEETEQMRAAGSPEFLYFNPSNPIPGYQPFAQGGSIQSGGIRDLYGNVDDQANGTVLSRDGYGLGRLQQMYGGGAIPGYADGGQIPTVGAVPQMSQAAQASYAVPPTNLAEVAGIGQDTSAPGVSGLSALNKQVSQATSDPMGRIGTSMTGPLAGMNPASIAYNMQMQKMQQAQALQGGNPAPTMQDYIQSATRTQLNPAMSPTGVEQQYFNQVNPRPVSAAQGGIMSLARGGKPSSGGYLDGPGDGMSDDIPATIAGKQPARLADGEFVVPADVVSHLGNGSTKAGAKHLYKMMDRVRQARTGTKKQGRQINPNRFLKA